ncbi:ribonuclease H-like domain-containing protein [Salinibacter altiplanensis]|uniref:ribonuclease H-like domain-containing protein n=1 Tax=Salinibacter altiplanensis TaxID=1803181 RepID=UPI000C9FF299|nr:ribonuclease H-like domain-containing protein [Salinibacter altiplanensis]
MVAVALDIETCPLPVDGFSDTHRERYEKELKHEQEKNPECSEAEASKRARSFHPYLGWVCCVSVVRGGLGSKRSDPRSWSASTPSGEEQMLNDFWDDVQHVVKRMKRHGEELVWATFNGKDFDVPFLTARSSHHGIAPTSQGLLDSYPYGHTPHADLSTIWPSSHYSLEGMCAHLGIDSPKDGMDGSEVAPAVANGRMDEVQAYCERDAVATYRCLKSVQWAL